jgi:hypothetical protein
LTEHAANTANLASAAKAAVDGAEPESALSDGVAAGAR